MQKPENKPKNEDRKEQRSDTSYCERVAGK